MSKKDPKAHKVLDLKEDEYSRIGKLFVDSIERGIYDKKQLYRTALIKGILGGFGSVLGATVLVGLLLWLLTLLSEVSIIGPVIESLKNTVSNQTN